MIKKHTSKLVRSFNLAITGIFTALKSERNMKIHIIAAILVFTLSLFFRLTQSEILFIALAVALVLITELFNTAIEKLGDAITKEKNELIKDAKDIAAGAVLVATIFAVVVGVVVFNTDAQNEMNLVIKVISESPIYIIFICIIVTSIVVILVKKMTKGTIQLKGGFPSLHTAIAFCIATGISLITKNIYASIFSLIIAALVGESRIETKIHSFLEVIFGAIFGVGIALLIFRLMEVIT